MMLDHYYDRATAGQIMELQPAGLRPRNAIEAHGARLRGQERARGLIRGIKIGLAFCIPFWLAVLLLVLAGCAPRDAAEAERFARYRAAANASLQTSLGAISDNRPVVCQRYGNTAVCQ